jgi:hypothetical protein
MRRGLIGLFVLAMAFLGSVVLAQGGAEKEVVEKTKDSPVPHEVVDKVKLMLSGYEYFPTKEDLVRVSPRAFEVLDDIARDETALPSMRTRALDALGLYEGKAEVALILEQILAEERLKDVFLRHAVTSSMKAFGNHALPWVAPYLNHKDVQLRLSAVHAVGHFGGELGQEVLLQRVEIERDELVIERIKRFSF